MSGSTPRSPGSAQLFLAVLLSGAAGLTWEVMYQHHSSLALGISAYGTAVTLSAVMGGMGLGGLLAARLARRGRLLRPLRAYGVAEIVIGLSSLAIAPGLELVAAADAAVWGTSPALAPLVRLLGTTLLLLLPSVAMGVTIPVLAPAARRMGSSVATAYALNTAGAVLGVLFVTFFLLPSLGVFRTSLVAALVNLAVGFWAIAAGGEGDPVETERSQAWPAPRALALAFLSGYVIFALEVSWFRSIRAALQSTTEAFAIILAAFLVALSVGAALAGAMRRRSIQGLRFVLPLAALSVFGFTPLIDMLDLFLTPEVGGSVAPSLFSPELGLIRFAWVFALCGVPATLLGIVFPSLLAEHDSTSGSGRLYAANTIGAVCGSCITGFVLLPTIGATHASWIAALCVGLASVLHERRLRYVAATAAALVAGFFLARLGEPNSPAHRAQGHGWPRDVEVEFVRENADSTTWVLKLNVLVRFLVIDGFVASAEHEASSYMHWMGHLPALAARKLDHAMVICMGTGQTSNAVRMHGPGTLEIVDLNEAVFEAAPLFRSNRGVLDDPTVTPVIMDGRAFLRRTPRRYDVITLEPMPPNFAGSNHLYSSEFYELARDRLAPGGVVAQWLPIHLVSTPHMYAITASFRDVFPYTRVWQSPVDQTCVLVGGLEPWEIRRTDLELVYDHAEIQEQLILDYDEVTSFVEGAERVTDDNQLLSYGAGRFARKPRPGNAWSMRLARKNTGLLLEHRRE